MLSAHFLDFSSDNTSWWCRKEISSTEGWGVYDVDYLALEKVARGLESGTLEGWHHIVRDYTTRSLTRPSDKLPAFSGVIATLQHMVGDTCHAALWKRNFVQLLLWDVPFDNPGRSCAARPNKWRAPSWSFVSIDGCVEYDHWTKHYCPTEEVIFAKLEECNVVPLDINNPLGELRSVSIMLEHVPVYTHIHRAMHVSQGQ
jgi:hypothetical protein